MKINARFKDLVGTAALKNIFDWGEMVPHSGFDILAFLIVKFLPLL